MKDTLKFALLLLLGTACVQVPRSDQGLSILQPTQLVRYQSLPRSAGGVPFHMGFNSAGESSETLHFFLSKEGDAVITRYLGPGGPSLIYFSIRTKEDEHGFSLLCKISGSSTSPILARWTLSESGEAENVYIRTTPILEWRKTTRIAATDTLASTTVVEWRPLNNKGDSGVGDWMRQ